MLDMEIPWKPITYIKYQLFARNSSKKAKRNRVMYVQHTKFPFMEINKRSENKFFSNYDQKLLYER